MMHKTQKSQLGVFIQDGIQEIIETPDNPMFVIDGGYLSRKVIWPDTVTYDQGYSEYVLFVLCHPFQALS